MTEALTVAPGTAAARGAREDVEAAMAHVAIEEMGG